MAALRRIAERNVAEVERIVRSYFGDRDGLEPISARNWRSGCAREQSSFSTLGPKMNSLWDICPAL
ncbi:MULTISPECIES: hypothetical protein [unclassified Methylocystis]|uniref:hypothetical protein n=1 Tax=unclassified Methylocystis TaxID=2625913 RepID=UPI001FEDCCBB|nr:MULTISPECIES: hypothetical protein [unclassified Methylocystis]